MAKGKRAAALFEVINQQKQSETRMAAPFSIPNPMRWLQSRRESMAARETKAPASPPPVRRVSASSHTLSIDLDPDRHLISLRVSYANAATAGFAVLVLLTLAFIVGRRVGAAGLPAVVATTEQLRNYPPHPTVLNVSRATETQSGPPLLLSTASTPSSSSDTPVPQGIVVPDGQRQIGLNYVIVQSYPDEKSANDARDMLNANGIPCTVERSLPGWNSSNWFSVIGSTGFDRIKSAQYEAYEAAIKSLSAKFAGTSKFKRFEPHPYKWKEAR